MNLNDLKKWAEDNAKKDSTQLLAMGVKERGLGKIKPHSLSIAQCCSIILANTKKNNECMNILENDLKYLAGWGLPAYENKVEAPATPTVTPPKQGFFDKRDK